MRRNVATAVVLSILTCGLYGIYWIYVMANEMNALEENPYGTSGLQVVALTILTFGLDGVYFVYRFGQRMYDLSNDYGILTSDNSIINMVLFLASYFIPGAYIVTLAIMQNDMNKIIDLKYYEQYTQN